MNNLYYFKVVFRLFMKIIPYLIWKCNMLNVLNIEAIFKINQILILLIK